MERAYEILPVQLSGPEWISSSHYDISARFPAETKVSDRAAMLRNLLEERFKLKVHWDTRTMSGYALTVANGGFKLKPVDSDGGTDMNSTGSAVLALSARRMPLAVLADFISRSVGELVVDHTNIAGVYDVELRWTADDLASGDGGAGQAPSLFTALHETAGLRLVRERVAAKVLVVDGAERVPTEN